MQRDLDAPAGGQDVDAVEGVFRVVQHRAQLLEPLVQRFELDLHHARQLGVEALRHDQCIDSLGAGADLGCRGRDARDRFVGGEDGGGGEAGARDPVFGEVSFPDEEGGGRVEDELAGEDAADALLAGEDPRAVGGFGVEELAGEFGDSISWEWVLVRGVVELGWVRR